jgi:hypothetical protein
VEALGKKREADRLRNQERRRQQRLTQHDPLALLVDTETQRQMLQSINEEEISPNVNHSQRLEPTEEYNEGFEWEDSLILDSGFSDDDWNGDELGIVLY